MSDMTTMEWEQTRDRIIALEERIVEGTNDVRDAIIEQGDLLGRIPAPRGGDQSGPRTTLLQRMAEECGITYDTAKSRRAMAGQITPEVRTLLREYPDVACSFSTIRSALSGDNGGVHVLRDLLDEAREEGKTRVTRDDARRARDLVTGTVGEAKATAERMVRDPEFAQSVIDAVPDAHIEEVAEKVAESATDRVLDQVGARGKATPAPTPEPRWQKELRTAAVALTHVLQEAQKAEADGKVSLGTSIRDAAADRIAAVFAEHKVEVSI